MGAAGPIQVDIIIPARNEEAQIGRILGELLRPHSDLAPFLNTVLVVDDHSTDDTARIAASWGAQVVSRRSMTTDGPGKGQALALGFAASKAQIVVACDADLESLESSQLAKLVSPLLSDPDIVMAKAAYHQPADVPGDFQRVTTLTALPLLQIFYPSLFSFKSPLAGEFALRRSVFDKVRLMPGYAVDIALLIDVAELYGADAIAEIDLGEKHHRHHPLTKLADQGLEVAAAILFKAGILSSSDLVRLGRVPAHEPEIIVPAT